MSSDSPIYTGREEIKNSKPKFANLGRFKLKDAENRHTLLIDFKSALGHPVDRVIITKTPGQNNTIEVIVELKE